MSDHLHPNEKIENMTQVLGLMLELNIDLLQQQFKSKNLKIECEPYAGVCVDAVWAEEGLAPREGDPRLQG